MTVDQFFLVLRARYMTVLFILAVTVGATVCITLSLPKTYTATTTLVIDYTEPITPGLQPKELSPSYMGTQLDIIQSGSVALRVADRLNLTDRPTFRTAFVGDGSAHSTIRQWMAERLQKGVKVIPSRDSRVIRISYTTGDPGLAADVANGFAEAYRDITLEMNVDPAKRGAEWFDEQRADLRQWLEEAQRKLANHQRQKGILTTDERLDTEIVRLNELTREIVDAQIAASEADTKVQEVNRIIESGASVTSLPKALSSPTYQKLQTDLVRYEAILTELYEKLDENHPRMKTVNAEISGLRKRMLREIHDIKENLQKNFSLARAKESALARKMEKQRAKVLKLKQTRDEIPALQREVRNAERAYELALQQYSNKTLQSRISETNVKVLHRAQRPLRHSSPNMQSNLFFAGFIGTLVGLAAVLFMEVFDRRVRSDKDIAEAINVPFLGTLETGRA